MKIKDGIVESDVTNSILKLSEQGVMSIVMVIQKVFVEMAQEKDPKSIEEHLEGYEFIVNNNELFVTNPVTISVDLLQQLEDEEDDEDDDCECEDCKKEREEENKIDPKDMN